MPALFILKERHTFALDSFRYNRKRTFSLPERRQNLSHIVTINNNRFPAKSFELLLPHLHIITVQRFTGLPQTITVSDSYQVFSFVIRRQSRSLPNTAFRKLSISHQDKHPSRTFLQTLSESHAKTCRQAL